MALCQASALFVAQEMPLTASSDSAFTGTGTITTKYSFPRDSNTVSRARQCEQLGSENTYTVCFLSAFGSPNFTTMSSGIDGGEVGMRFGLYCDGGPASVVA